MQRIGFKMYLLPGNAQEYKKRHEEIWPELVALLKHAGITAYDIFFDEETGLLFASYAIENLEAANALAGNAVMKKWWAYMADIMVTNNDHSPVIGPLEEMFYLP